jgi:hypothetical protein
MMRISQTTTAEKGNVLFYILIAVALLAALTYVVARGGGDSGSGMTATRVAEEIKSQSQMIRSAIMECVINNNYGYPAEPVSGLVADVQCQTSATPTYQTIFSGATGRFMPQPPKPFTAGWAYDVDTGTTPNTISISLTQAMNCAADQGLVSALDDILPTQYATAEVDTTCDGTTANFTLYIVKP